MRGRANRTHPYPPRHRTCLATARVPRCRLLCQGYKMRDEDIDEYDRIVNPDHDGGIYTAVNAWCTNPAAAKARYGRMAS